VPKDQLLTRLRRIERFGIDTEKNPDLMNRARPGTMTATRARSGAAGVPPPHSARLPTAVYGVAARLLRDVESRIGAVDGLVE
jgi:hypothetical protein